jgi:hypothetical protein
MRTEVGGGGDLSWTFEGGVKRVDVVGGSGGGNGFGFETGGWMGLGAIALVTGVVAGIAEALGMSLRLCIGFCC